MSDTTPTPAAQPTILGVLDPAEMQALTELRQRSEQAVFHLGKLALQESKLIRTVELLENQAQGVIQGAGKRLGIPDGTPWSVQADGTAILAGAPQVVVPTPAEDEGSSGD